MDELPGDDPVLDAIDELLSVARSNIVAWVTVMERVERMRALRRAGSRYRAMELGDDTPRVIDIVNQNQDRLVTAAARFRRAIARQLQEEGMSAAEIARVFGVTRQRVSSLLKGGTAQ